VFLDLFYELRGEGVPVSIQEWMLLMEALAKHQHGSSLLRFYHLSRACLVKSESYFDAFDRVFARVFEGVEGELDITDEVLAWLNDPKNFKELSDERADATPVRDPRRTDRTPRRRRPLGGHRGPLSVRPRR
jgi:uncharacterized protein with von Willebrand factor type A (vWA) domain